MHIFHEPAPFLIDFNYKLIVILYFTFFNISYMIKLQKLRS